MLVFGAIENTALFTQISGGAVGLAETNPEKYKSIFENLPALVIAGPIALIFMAIAFLLPETTTESE